MKERMVATKQRPENSISQPLIGEDYQCCGEFIYLLLYSTSAEGL